MPRWLEWIKNFVVGIIPLVLACLSAGVIRAVLFAQGITGTLMLEAITLIAFVVSWILAFYFTAAIVDRRSP